MFQHTAARRRLDVRRRKSAVAGMVSTHSRPKAAGAVVASAYCRARLFQHTAARRRLVKQLLTALEIDNVSTHSRPKAAGAVHIQEARNDVSFNTQPPEGGWFPAKNCPS